MICGKIWFAKDENTQPSSITYLDDVNRFLLRSILSLKSDGGIELESILGTKSLFDYPKPTSLIQILLGALNFGSTNLTVLDFFAGSGTTLHATMALNSTDEGKRQCLLVTNNENNICEEVTYERNKRVIEGYTNKKGEKILGLKNNTLRYFKTDYVEREASLMNKKALVKASVDLLCIKEDCYNELDHDYQNLKVFESADFNLIVVLNTDGLEESFEFIKNTQKKSKVYVFAPGAYPHTEEYEEELTAEEFNRIELCALPEAIYRAYQRVLRDVDRRASGVKVVNQDGEENASV